MLFVAYLLVFPNVKKKKKKDFGKTKTNKKQKKRNLRENQQKLLENQKKTKCFKGFRPTLKYGFVFFIVWFSLMCFCVFVFRIFVNFLKTFGKTKKTNNNNNKQYPRVGLKPLKTVLLLVFPKVVLVFFGFLLYVWFSLTFVWFSKNLRENQKNKKKHIQGWV